MKGEKVWARFITAVIAQMTIDDNCRVRCGRSIGEQVWARC